VSIRGKRLPASFIAFGDCAVLIVVAKSVSSVRDELLLLDLLDELLSRRENGDAGLVLLRDFCGKAGSDVLRRKKDFIFGRSSSYLEIWTR